MAESNNALAQRIQQQMLTPAVQQFRQIMLGIYQAHKKTLVSRLGNEEKAKNLMASVVLYADKNPKLIECTPQSLWECISNSVNSGFWPVGFPPMVYYIPFKDNKTGKITATFVPHYNAYVTRMFDSGHVRKINCKVVRQRDHFVHNEGSNERIEFKSFREGDRGERVAVFCITVNQFGMEQITVLYADDVEGIRSKSRAKDTGPWSSKIPLEVDWMWMKSAIKQHRKLLPSLPAVYDEEDEHDVQPKGIGLAEANPFDDGGELGTGGVILPLPASSESVNVETGEVVEAEKAPTPNY